MTANKKRKKFLALAKAPSVETGRQFEEHFGQLEFNFSPMKKRAQDPNRKRLKGASR